MTKTLTDVCSVPRYSSPGGLAYADDPTAADVAACNEEARKAVTERHLPLRRTRRVSKTPGRAVSTRRNVRTRAGRSPSHRTRKSREWTRGARRTPGIEQDIVSACAG